MLDFLLGFIFRDLLETRFGRIIGGVALILFLSAVAGLVIGGIVAALFSSEIGRYAGAIGFVGSVAFIALLVREMKRQEIIR